MVHDGVWAGYGCGVGDQDMWLQAHYSLCALLHHSTLMYLFVNRLSTLSIIKTAFWWVTMSDLHTQIDLLVQLHHAAMPIGGGDIQFMYTPEKIDTSLSFLEVFRCLKHCAPYELVAIDLLESKDPSKFSTSKPYTVLDFDKNVGQQIFFLKSVDAHIKILRCSS